MIDFASALDGRGSPAAQCDRWLADLDLSRPVSSNTPSLEIPFQRWFKFKEAFAPQFIIDCIQSMDIPVRHCLDPFGGSGTTALTCQFLGLSATTIEVNPFLADLIEAKVTTYDLAALKRDYLTVIEGARRDKLSNYKVTVDGPETLVQPGKDGRWIFSRDAADMILCLRQAIDALRSTAHKRLLRAVLGSILVSISNVVVNGKGRKYRRGWETKVKTGRDVDTAFREAFYIVYADVSRFATRPRGRVTVLRGDSRELVSMAEPADVVIFSPPYPNSFDYTDIYNLELWMLGYLGTKEDNRRLRQQTVRSHVQIKRDWSSGELESRELYRNYDRLCRQRKELWNPDIPEMVIAYFGDMDRILRQVKRKLRRGGRAFLAVGNSKYAGVLVDTAKILTELAPSVGFRTCDIAPIRSMRSSAQQGGRAELKESLLVFS